MQLVKRDGDGFELCEMDLADLRVLAAASREADPTGHPAAEERLFPDPLADHSAGEKADGDRDEDVESFLDDWHSYVRPDLKDAFDTAAGTFSRDLENAELIPGGEGQEKRFRIRVPGDHAEAWLSILNQARLVMHAKHDLPETDDIDDIATLAESGKLEPFLLSRFYASIQEWLVHHYL